MNALAMEALPIFLDKLTSPVIAIVLSVTAVLIFGEIVPQALCKSYGLNIGAATSPIVRLLILVTTPVTWPIGKILDWILGGGHGALFRRAELKALVDIHGQTEGLSGGYLTQEEIGIIRGALDLTNKTAQASMTPLEKVTMLPSDAELNESALMTVLQSGHSRIPIHSPGNRQQIVGVLLVKDLLSVLLKSTLASCGSGLRVADLRMRHIPALRADTPMYDVLKVFQTGRSHMAALTEVVAAPMLTAEKRADEVVVQIDTAAVPEDKPLQAMKEVTASRSKVAAVGVQQKVTVPSTTATEPLQQQQHEEQPQQQHQQQQHQQQQQPTFTTAAPFTHAEKAPQQQHVSPPFLSATPATHADDPLQLEPPASPFAAAAAVTAEMAGGGPLPPPPQQQQQQQPASPFSAAAAFAAETGRGAAPLQRVTGKQPGAPVGPPVGIITIEDVIEELIQAEIVDETDQFVDNLRSQEVNTAVLMNELPSTLRAAIQGSRRYSAQLHASGALPDGHHSSPRRTRQVVPWAEGGDSRTAANRLPSRASATALSGLGDGAARAKGP